MLPAQRRQALVTHLKAEEWASTAVMADLLGVSEITVRRDLAELEEQGLLRREHGGARYLDSPVAETTGSGPEPDDVVEAIARAAADLVVEGDAVLLGAGSLPAALARQLTARRALTVITNSLAAAEELSAGPHRVDVIMTGGTLDTDALALVGGTAESMLAGLHARCAFITGGGLSAEQGLSESDVALAAIHASMADAAAEVVALAPSAILGRHDLARSVAPGQLTRVVTDAPDHPEVRALAAGATSVLAAQIR